MKHSVCAISALAVLAGCVSAPGTGFIGHRPLDSSYQSSVLNWHSGATTVIGLKAIDHDGKLGLCGAYITEGGLHVLAEAAWVDQSKVYFGDTLLALGKFMNEQQKKEGGGYTATCIRTDLPYKPEYAARRVRIDGPRSVTYYH